MSEDSPHPLPTWEEFASVQAGRWFFLKWMLVGAAAAAGFVVVTIANNRLFPIANWWKPLLITSWALGSGAAQGWALFRWRLETWGWAVGCCCPLFLGLGMVGGGLIIIVGLGLQVHLLDRVRRRAAWWLLASPFSLVLSAWLASFAWNPIYFLLRRLTQIVSLPAGLGGGLFEICIIFMLYSLLTGSALAWAMLPVSPSGQKVPGGDEKG